MFLHSQAEIIVSPAMTKQTLDVVEIEGALWLVPEWVGTGPHSERHPARIIRLTGQPYSTHSNGLETVLRLERPIPVDLLTGVSKGAGENEFVVHCWADLPEN